MIYIITGCVAYIFLYIFDLNKINYLHKNLNICFAMGILLLGFSTAGILFGNFKSMGIPTLLKLLFGIIAVISLILLLYCLFLALPFKKTYVQAVGGNTVIDTGVYGLCRHPGAIWFFLFYFFLWLATGKMMMLWAAIIWTSMNVIHVYVQDRWLLPKTLKGYDQYKTEVPFLIPSIASIKKFISI